MKSLRSFILEELDDNVLWKIEMWFKRKPQDYNEFCKFIKTCTTVPVITDEAIDNYLNNSKLKLKQFIDFLDDSIVNNDVNKDYKYLFKKVIELIIGNKQNNIINAGN